MRFKSTPALMALRPLSEVFFQVAKSCTSSITVLKILLLAWPNKGSMVAVPRLLVVYGGTYVQDVVGLVPPPMVKYLLSDSCGFWPMMPKLLLPKAPPPE